MFLPVLTRLLRGSSDCEGALGTFWSWCSRTFLCVRNFKSGAWVYGGSGRNRARNGFAEHHAQYASERRIGYRFFRRALRTSSERIPPMKGRPVRRAHNWSLERTHAMGLPLSQDRISAFSAANLYFGMPAPSREEKIRVGLRKILLRPVTITSHIRAMLSGSIPSSRSLELLPRLGQGAIAFTPQSGNFPTDSIFLDGL